MRLFHYKEGGITTMTASWRELNAPTLRWYISSLSAYHLEVSPLDQPTAGSGKGDFVRYIDRLARIKLREPMGEQKVLSARFAVWKGTQSFLALEKGNRPDRFEKYIKGTLDTVVTRCDRFCSAAIRP